MEKKHAVVFRNGQKEIFYSLADFNQNTKPKDILQHRAFRSEIDAAMWLYFPDEFPATKQFYAVKIGCCPGIYRTQQEAITQVKGVSESKYQGFYTIEAAEAWLRKPVPTHNVDGACYCSINPVGALRIYTDASFKQPDRASYAIHIIDEAGMTVTLGGKASGICDSGEAELYAMVVALRGIDRNSKAKIAIYTDCQYLFQHVYSHKGKGKEERKLWEEFFSYAKIFEISVNWVKGHSDDEHNVLCDKLAGQLNN